MNRLTTPLLLVALCASGAALYMGYLLSKTEPISARAPVESKPERTQDPIAPDAPESESSGSPENSILQLLNHQDPKVRREALELLAALKPEFLKERLANLLENEVDATCRLVILNVIGKLNVKQAYEAVLARFEDKDVAVRRKAAGTLGELAKNLEDGQKQRAARAVTVAMERERTEALQRKRSVSSGALFPYLVALGKLKTSDSNQALLKYMRVGKEPLLRRCAAQALSGCVIKSNENALKAAWRSETDRMVRSEIEKILAQEPFKLKVDRKRMVLISEAK